MNSFTRKDHQKLYFTVLISFTLIVSIALGGCEPLRKKFTRKKKESVQDNMEVPVLEPIEYPKKIYTIPETYKLHFSIWRGWYEDLLAGFSENDSRKRQNYLLGQAIVQMEEMEKLLIPEKQAELRKDIATLKKIQAEISSPVMPRSMTSVAMELESVDRRMRNKFSFSKIKDSIVKE
ncbi:MAG TPA: hypothetical protein PL155_00225 [Candidatus Omnitrophota bacterium]|nr:hypothetical protein [Candidatus Omnitrophota bacterium]HPD85088.1 hypothetical protein [Candidatus Omnitrophota bacterium]HRZ03946.1 hypothetical protein [Candidatus Omnitrophota bacterium]